MPLKRGLGFCLLLVWFAGGTVAAEVDVDAERLEAARQALALFNETPPHLPTRDDQDELRSSVDDVCWMPQPDCLAYLRGHRVRLLQAIPNNPAYWKRWREFLTVGPAGLDPAGILSENPRTDYSGLMDPPQYLLLRDLALDGELDVTQFVEVAEQLRRLLIASGTVLERMIYNASYTQVINWANVAMAVSSARYDDRSVDTLRNQLRLLSPEERDFSRVVAGEAEYMRQSMKQQSQMSSAVLEKYGMDISPYQLEQNRLQMQEAVTAFPEQSAVIIELSRREESRFWQEGTGLAPARAIDDPGFDPYDVTTTWRMYVGVDLLINLNVRVLQKLAEIYGGHASPGLPAQPAPVGWRWDWQDDRQQLCLEAVSVHPSALEATHGEPICHVYFDAEAASFLR